MQLLDLGILTQKEFDAAKKRMLSAEVSPNNSASQAIPENNE